MTPTPTEPRIRKARLRVVLPWLLASLFVLLALYALGGRLITSRIAGNEAALGALLSGALGLEVEIGRAEGRFLGWHPVIEAEGIRLAPPGAAPAIRVGSMQLELDVIESLFRGHPVATTLVLEEARVDLARGPDGGWRLREGRGGLAPDIEPIVSFLYHSDAVDLRRSRVDFHPPQPEEGGAEQDRITRLELDGGLVNERGSHRGHLLVKLDSAAGTGTPASGEMYLSLAGNPLTRATRAGEVLVDLENVRLATLSGTLPARRPLMHGVLDRLRLRARIDPVDGIDLAARASAERLAARAGGSGPAAKCAAGCRRLRPGAGAGRPGLPESARPGGRPLADHGRCAPRLASGRLVQGLARGAARIRRRGDRGPRTHPGRARRPGQSLAGRVWIRTRRFNVPACTMVKRTARWRSRSVCGIWTCRAFAAFRRSGRRCGHRAASWWRLDRSGLRALLPALPGRVPGGLALSVGSRPDRLPVRGRGPAAAERWSADPRRHGHGDRPLRPVSAARARATPDHAHARRPGRGRCLHRGLSSGSARSRTAPLARGCGPGGTRRPGGGAGSR
ncbi:MAG: hypothetical protein U5R48_15960 [Gammaproteobacteria bacterium]|nr:hypothetical protein [Gammaproteobacteria bacterium]